MIKDCKWCPVVLIQWFWLCHTYIQLIRLNANHSWWVFNVVYTVGRVRGRGRGPWFVRRNKSNMKYIQNNYQVHSTHLTDTSVIFTFTALLSYCTCLLYIHIPNYPSLINTKTGSILTLPLKWPSLLRSIILFVPNPPFTCLTCMFFEEDFHLPYFLLLLHSFMNIHSWRTVLCDPDGNRQRPEGVNGGGRSAKMLPTVS